VAENEPNGRRVSVEQHPHGRFPTAAHGALKIAVFNDRDPRMRSTANVVGWIHGNDQIVTELLAHPNSPAAHRATGLRPLTTPL
jgi:hypothetical protein